MNDSWKFSFAGRTIDYFGSKAITSDITALFELIKNSRDANAKQVTIHFKEPNKKNGLIVVHDDGDGMSETDVKEKWMVIGTDSRLRDDKTKNGKPVWGEMGIGRMACQKLGSLVELTSVKNNQRVRMTFDWSLFEKTGATVDNITFPVKTDSPKDAENGLALAIKNLKSGWSGTKINGLKLELSILIANESFDDTAIIVRVGEGDGEPIGKNYAKLRESVTDSAPFKLKAEFDGSRLTASVCTQVGQKGTWEEQDVSETFDGSCVGPFTADIFHFPRASGKEKASTLETYYEKRMGVDKLEGFLKNSHGMYLYRDGAWMKPYGGETDWLALEAGARQATSKIGIKQIYGQVSLSKNKNPEIRPASHRETLIKNDAYADLKKIMRCIFEILRRYMKNWKKQQKGDVLKGMGGKTTEGEDTIDELATKVYKGTSGLTPQQRKDIKRALDGIQKIVSMEREESSERIAEMNETKRHEKNLATLGIATSFMARQVTGPLESNMGIVGEVEKRIGKIKDRGGQLSEQEIVQTEEMLTWMKRNQNQMLHFMKFVDILARHIAQSINRNRQYTQVDVGKCWQTVSEGFQDRQRQLGIGISDGRTDSRNNSIRRNLVVKMDKIDLECILTNLYLNSMESLEHTGGRAPKVKYHYMHTDNGLAIEFSDNGRGIPTKRLKEVFEPFKLGHDQGSDRMHGHGLGLHIVRKIVENYGGTAEAVDVKEGATIRLVLPKVVKVAR